MNRQTRRGPSPDSHSEQRLNKFLQDFIDLDLTKDGAKKEFCQTFSNSSELQSSIYYFLSKERDHSENDIEILQQLCQYLLFFYRTVTSTPGGRSQPGKSTFVPASTTNEIMKNRVYFVQFLPHWISLHLLMRYSNHRTKYQFLDAFLLSVYNSEAMDQPLPSNTSSSLYNPLQRPAYVKVPSLASSSLYHDSTRLESEDKLDQRPSGLTFHFETYGFIDRMTASTRPIVLRLLMQTFNRQITDISKVGLEQFTRSSLRLLECGYGTNKINQARVHLEPPLMMEYLFSAYVCMYNGFQVVGNQILDHIHNRASLSGCPEVLLLSNSIKSLVLASSPSQVQSAHVSTPVQIAKNMITNASFRAKRMQQDIPKLQVDSSEDGTTGSGASRNNLISMTSIVEEGESGTKDELDKGTTKGETSSKGFNKLIPKLRKKTLSVNEDTSSSGAGCEQPLLKPKSSIEKKEKNQLLNPHKKKKERIDSSKSEKSDASVNETVPLVSGLNGDSTSAASNSSKEYDRYDTVEKVEELIQMKKLPTETTITVHSPESGTTSIY